MKTRIFLLTLLVSVAVIVAIRSILPLTSAVVTHSKKGREYDSYAYGGPAEKILDFGTQPNSIFRSEPLFHDRVLRRQLAAEGWKLREHRYLNGRDMLPYCDGRLDVMVLGDLPSYMAMAKHNVGIFALFRQGYNTIVANRRLTPHELKGLRIGYPPNTTSHFTLARTLETAGVSMKDITSVPMSPNEMEKAFRTKQVDAIVSWEPVAARVLDVPDSFAVAVSEGFTYVAFDLDFASRNPKIQKILLAAVVRAVNWGRLDERNVRASLQWDQSASRLFLGSSTIDVNDRMVELVNRETVGNSNYPMLPLDFGQEDGVQRQQFEFLKTIGAIPRGTGWKRILDRVNTRLMSEIIRDGGKWRIYRYDYAPRKLESMP